MKLFFAGQWRDTDATVEVTNPFDDSVIDEVPKASAADVDQALETLVNGAKAMRAMTAYRRAEILSKAADLMRQRRDEFAETISREEGKPLSEAKTEASRSIETMTLSAEEAKRITGETVPMDAASNGSGRMGFTIRVPCGVVAAITPFNFPLNLVVHKVGPALAAGNAILVKPASDTPLSALKLIEVLLEAGVPDEAMACLVGPGSELGEAICTDERVRKISFTGSDEVGAKICKMAGIKKVTMELGGNAPVIVMDDADVDAVAAAIARGGYANAGQTCISAQRIYTSRKIHGDAIDALKSQVAQLKVGDQLQPETKVGPLVRTHDAERVESWIDDAIAAGAQKILGGQRDGSIYQPTILDQVTADMRVSCDELFGPAVVTQAVDGIDEAIELATDTRYGLAAGIFTQNIAHALRFAREVDCGVLNINGTSTYRADLMPYGGLKESGLGKEGPKYTVREMTEEKMVVFHP
ncbi:aldehyde dehydrogenase family protein [Stratiformator vulcanicus]|uniref:Glutarate-semialdehyde dehydrogenase DavD n=1 Tax=Stratiformator vulcanicus TaxID=2527980 RepID=A0A517R5N3_9PLAN|nr:aldehyde dehydrogenase family protein [Stratiformator vulcanicus]QDT39169.1 Glutarate-semialdehyde dehydrogenase DavD [Stratiformator vulcanicus]